MIKPLVWNKRCRKDQTIVADRKIWGTKCGKYRVVFSHIRYGEQAPKKQKWADKWYAEELNNNKCWEIISEHTKKETAQKACEKRQKQKEKNAAKLERLEKKKSRRRRISRTRARTTKQTRATKHTKTDSKIERSKRRRAS